MCVHRARHDRLTTLSRMHASMRARAHIHTHTHTRTPCTHTYIHVHTYAHEHTHIHTHANTHTNTHIHPRTNTRTQTHTRARIQTQRVCPEADAAVDRMQTLKLVTTAPNCSVHGEADLTTGCVHPVLDIRSSVYSYLPEATSPSSASTPPTDHHLKPHNRSLLLSYNGHCRLNSHDCSQSLS